jgi:hypothetical protein
MTPKPDVCELLIQDAEHYQRVQDHASKKKFYLVSLFALCGAMMALYCLTSSGSGLQATKVSLQDTDADWTSGDGSDDEVSSPL